MKFFVIGFLTACLVAGVTNNELRSENRALKERLKKLKKNELFLNEDFKYSKEKIGGFIKSYDETADLFVKFELLQGIEYYLSEILSDFAEKNELEGVGKKEIEDIVEKLNKQLVRHKIFLFSKEISEKFNSLKQRFEGKVSEVKKLQLENAEILAKFGKREGEVKELLLKTSQIQEKIENSEKDLNDLKFIYNTHLENLQKTFQFQSLVDKSKEDFKEIQISQDEVIVELQRQSEELALTTQQLSVEKHELEGKIELLLNNIQRLERDLLSKSSELLKSENKFEDFRANIEASTQSDLEQLKAIEKVYLEDIEKLDSEVRCKSEILETCLSKSEIAELTQRKSFNKINELQEELQGTQLRITNSKVAKQKEIEYILQKISDIEIERQKAAQQQKEAEQKISENFKEIERFKSQLTEAEYSLKRNIN